MKQPPITKALSSDAILWLLYAWFSKQNNMPIRLLLYAEMVRRNLYGKYKIQHRVSHHKPQIISEINHYFVDLLPDAVPDISPDFLSAMQDAALNQMTK